MGRQFACHVYNEDDLTPASVSQSMFDIPIEAHEIGDAHDVDAPGKYNDKDESKSDGTSTSTIASTSTDEGSTDEGSYIKKKDGSEEEIPDLVVDDGVEFVLTADLDSYLLGIKTISPPKLHNLDKKIFTESMSILEGSCSQLHLGWWSYEWCHNNKVTQFHVQVQGNQMDNVVSVQDLMPEFVVQSVTTVGTFTKRKIVVEVSWEGSKKPDYYMDDDDDVRIIEDDDDGEDDVYVEYVEGKSDDVRIFEDDDDGEDDVYVEGKSTGKDEDKVVDVKIQDVMIVDTYSNGEYCEEAKAKRVVEVRSRCCSNDEIMKSIQKAGGTVQNPDFFSTPFDDTDAARAILLSVQEQSVCNYVAHVCTNILCNSWIHESIEDMKLDDKESKDLAEFQRDESIRHILDKTLVDKCLKKNEGWWTYNFCYQSSAYQFHESVDLDLEKGVMKTTIEAKHVLGKYDPVTSEGFPKEDEVKHIIFPQGYLNDGFETGNGRESMGLDSAYYVQEYTHGDICEGDDVIDSAIKGGEVGEGVIQRSSTIRFFCGVNRELVRINEDHTCHYIIDIAVPELCAHKYFERPHIKKHAVKCLPV